MGLMLFVGVVLSGGPANLIGHKGPAVAIGNWIMILTGITVVTAGVRAGHRPKRMRTPDDTRPDSGPATTL